MRATQAHHQELQPVFRFLHSILSRYFALLSEQKKKPHHHHYHPKKKKEKREALNECFTLPHSFYFIFFFSLRSWLAELPGNAYWHRKKREIHDSFIGQHFHPSKPKGTRRREKIKIIRRRRRKKQELKLPKWLSLLFFYTTFIPVGRESLTKKKQKIGSETRLSKRLQRKTDNFQKINSSNLFSSAKRKKVV